MAAAHSRQPLAGRVGVLARSAFGGACSRFFLAAIAHSPWTAPSSPTDLDERRWGCDFAGPRYSPGFGRTPPAARTPRMSLQAYPPAPRSLEFARQILRAEASALHDVADRLDDGFVRAVDLLAACRGRVAVTGVGKSADVSAKIVGTLNSTGTRAYLLDATKAMHGDLGIGPSGRHRRRLIAFR